MNPICSMTGFGRAEKVTEEYRLQVEIKSVNHRYLDLSVKMPRKLNCLEAQLRQILKEYMERGKTDIYVSYEDYSEGSKKLLFNKEIAGEYLKYLQQMAEEFGLKNEISASVLGRFPEVFSMEESSDDEGKLLAMLEPVAREAFADFRRAREEEGERLREDLLGKLSAMEDYVRVIEGLSPSVVDTYRQKLYSKLTETLKETGLSADEARIVTEVTIYSDKVCTDEEMVRLKSHIASMKQKLQKGGPCGRELDFIAQEMNREANTTLSKANSLSVADTAIALKTEIEKVREQVQNIE